MSPLFEVCGDMLELLLTPPQLPMAGDASHDSQKQSHDSVFPRVWEQYLVENKFKWEEERDRRGVSILVLRIFDDLTCFYRSEGY